MYYLMNKDIPVLLFDFEDKYIKVLNNWFLPYMLKDYVIDSNFSEENKAKRTMECIDVFKDFFCSRLLNLSRSGAKEFLNVANLP